MALPTQAQLYEEVDRRFAADHPDAPHRLDPNDPNQQQWVHQWLEIRNHVLNEWTDRVFYEFFPGASRLDPNNPGDTDLIEYWKDIQHQINTSEAGRWSWDTVPPPPQLSVVSVEVHPSGQGFIVWFQRALVDLTEAEVYLWGQEHPPIGSGIGLYNSNSVHLEPTVDSLRLLPEDVARRISEISTLRAD